MHVLPQLRKLEQKYRDVLVVVHVHSAKFTTEQATRNLQRAVRRYDITAPVVNDAEFQVWQRYAARAWPTLFLVDPEGRILGKHEGEITFEALDGVLAEGMRKYGERGSLQRGPVAQLHPEAEAMPVLAFPGKVLADEASNRLFIVDSNHDRVLVASLDGDVQEVIGGGGNGLADGPFASARCNRPQGVALAGGLLYIADTENHAIRQADLHARTVTTIAGTGQQARAPGRGGPGPETALSSPWDLAVAGERLSIAMAGSHQLWSLDLRAGTVAPFAGSGREGIQDGPREHAWLAQPSGIVVQGGRLYFVDSETSAVRVVELESGHVWTIVGRDLFEFGDVDGKGEAVRLQHPLGLCWADGALFVADSYNHKIKRIEPSSRESRSVLGSGQPGKDDGSGLGASFHEPGGVSAAAGRLYIADTNNHAIRVADLATSAVFTLELRGL